MVRKKLIVVQLGNFMLNTASKFRCLAELVVTDLVAEWASTQTIVSDGVEDVLRPPQYVKVHLQVARQPFLQTLSPATSYTILRKMATNLLSFVGSVSKLLTRRYADFRALKSIVLEKLFNAGTAGKRELNELTLGLCPPHGRQGFSQTCSICSSRDLLEIEAYRGYAVQQFLTLSSFGCQRPLKVVLSEPQISEELLQNRVKIVGYFENRLPILSGNLPSLV